MKTIGSLTILATWLFAAIAPTAVAGFDIGPGLAANAWDAYKTLLKTKPLITKAVTSSGMMTFSDIICQKLTMAVKEKDENQEPERLDFPRVLHVAITGLTWSGPIQHWWFGTLDKIVQINETIPCLLAKLFLDAIIFSPITVGGYFTARSILEGSGVKGVQEKLSTRFFSTLVGAWKFWPIANMINFSFVPLQFRVLYSNILSLFWTGYLTYVNSKKIQSATKKGDSA